MSHPFTLENLAAPALDGIVRALSARGHQTDAERQAKADAATSLILSFQPRDVIELTLSGQAVLLNELLADGARDALREVVDTARLRGRAGVVAMGRLLQGHLDRLERRGNQPFRTEIAAPREAEGPGVAVASDVAEGLDRTVSDAAREDERLVPAEQPIVAEVLADPSAAIVPVTEGPEPPCREAAMEVVAFADVPAESGEAVEETSWLDAPFEQWRIKTPADLVALARAAADPETSAVLGGDFERGIDAARRGARPGAAFAREAAGYLPARTLVGAGAD